MAATSATSDEADTNDTDDKDDKDTKYDCKLAANLSGLSCSLITRYQGSYVYPS